jgi:hypothetical protein
MCHVRVRFNDSIVLGKTAHDVCKVARTRTLVNVEYDPASWAVVPHPTTVVVKVFPKWNVIRDWVTLGCVYDFTVYRKPTLRVSNAFVCKPTLSLKEVQRRRALCEGPKIGKLHNVGGRWYRGCTFCDEWLKREKEQTDLP